MKHNSLASKTTLTCLKSRTLDRVSVSRTMTFKSQLMEFFFWWTPQIGSVWRSTIFLGHTIKCQRVQQPSKCTLLTQRDVYKLNYHWISLLNNWTNSEVSFLLIFGEKSFRNDRFGEEVKVNVQAANKWKLLRLFHEFINIKNWLC